MSLEETYEVVIVGAGLIGSAAAKYAAEEFQGGKTLLIGPGAGTKSLDHGKDDVRLNGAWHDEGRIADSLGEDDLWNTLAEESIKRYDKIASQSGLEFFDPVGFLSVWKKSDLSNEYLEEITTRAKETQSTYVTNAYAATHFPYLRLPNDYFAYHQSPSTKMAGVVNPRKLIKAQQSIASTEYGCEFIEGQVDRITKISQNAKEENCTGPKFTLNVKRYIENDLSSSEQETFEIRANRIVLANGVYTNILPTYENIFDVQKVDKKPDLDLPCQTVAFLKVSKEVACGVMNGMPTLNINYDFGIVDGAYILPPILYPDGNYYLKIGHYNQFETNLNSDMKTITDWYKQGTGLPEAVKHFTDFITKELIVDPNIEFGEISSDCCVTVNTPGKIAPFIDEFAPGITLITGGCGNGAMCSDEIGRLGAKLSATGKWMSDKIPREKTLIKWKNVDRVK